MGSFLCFLAPPQDGEKGAQGPAAPQALEDLLLKLVSGLSETENVVPVMPGYDDHSIVVRTHPVTGCDTRAAAVDHAPNLPSHFVVRAAGVLPAAYTGNCMRRISETSRTAPSMTRPRTPVSWAASGMIAPHRARSR